MLMSGLGWKLLLLYYLMSMSISLVYNTNMEIFLVVYEKIIFLD